MKQVAMNIHECHAMMYIDSAESDMHQNEIAIERGHEIGTLERFRTTGATCHQ